MEILKTIIIGICIGIANVIPGVSGGTLVVVFNIYDKFVNVISFNLKYIKSHLKFVIPLIGGMGLGVVVFAKLIQVLYTRFPVQTDFFFTGLIIGSIPMLFSYMLKREDRKNSAKDYIGLIICVLAGLALILTFSYIESQVNPDDSAMQFILPEIQFKLLVKIFLAGILGAVAMVVPGISGSLLMLILGVYPIVMASIPALLNFDTFFHALFLLLPNGIGVLMGLVAGAKLISFLLKKFPHATYAVICGLICGSAYTLFPGVSDLNSVGMVIASIICLGAGFCMAFFSSRSSEEPEQTEIKTVETNNSEEGN